MSISLKTKKIFAREFLILLGVLLFLGVLIIASNFMQKKIDNEMRRVINEKENIIEKISITNFSIPISNHDTNDITLALKEFYKHYELENQLSDADYEDMAKRYAGKEYDLWNKLYNHYEPQWVENREKLLTDLANRYSNKYDNQKEILIRNSLEKEYNNLSIRKEKYNSLIDNIIIALFVICYPLRFIILIIIWAVKTLKE